MDNLQRQAAKTLKNLLTLAQKSQANLIISCPAPDQVDIKLGSNQADFSLTGESALAFASLLNETVKNGSGHPLLSGWQVTVSTKPKTYLLEPQSSHALHDFSDLVMDHAGKRQLYDTLMDGKGVIALSEMPSATAAQLASLMAQLYDSPNYHLLSISNQHHLINQGSQQLRPELINRQSASLKDFDADLIYWGDAQLPANPDTLWRLADAHLVIIYLGTGKTSAAATALADRLDWQEPQLKRLKHFVKVRPMAAICPDCRAGYNLDRQLADDHSSWLGIPADTLAGNQFYYGQGCANCEHSGTGATKLIAEIADCRQVAPNRQAWRQFFAEEPHKTWREIALQETLSGTFSLEELQKIF